MPDEDKTKVEEQDEDEITDLDDEPEVETETKPGGDKPTETPADKAGKEPEAHVETPEEKAARLELELAHTKGLLEGLKANAEPEPDPIEAVDSEIAQAEKELAEVSASIDGYSDPEEKAEARDRKADLRDKRDALKEKREALMSEGEQREANQAALRETIGAALKAQKLPDSAYNDLHGRVKERLKREGFRSGDNGHFQSALDAEAAQMALEQTGRATPRVAATQPAGGGRKAPVADTNPVKPGMSRKEAISALVAAGRIKD